MIDYGFWYWSLERSTMDGRGLADCICTFMITPALWNGMDGMIAFLHRLTAIDGFTQSQVLRLQVKKSKYSLI